MTAKQDEIKTLKICIGIAEDILPRSSCRQKELDANKKKLKELEK